MSWFVNRKTSFKLLSSFIFIAIILAGVSIFAIINMKKINTIGAEMYTAALKPMENMANAQNELLKLRIGWRDVTLAKSEASIDSKMEEIKKTREDIAENITIYKNSYETEGVEAQQEAQEFHDRFMSDFEAYNKAYDEAVQSVKKDSNSFKKLDAELNGYHDRLTTYLEEIWDVDMSISEEEYQNSEKMFSTTMKIMITIVILTLGICIALGFFLTKIIARPLHEMAEIMEKVAEGDLTEKAHIQTKDEVGILAQSVNHMIDNLKGMIKNIVIAAENLSASSEQVSASTEEIASASTNQATSAQTMNELFRELSEAINAVAQNTEQAAMLANKTMEIAQDGEKVVLSSVEGANLVSDQMSLLEQDSNKIGEIIEVIDDIADQTNLLALNAAIEAARAGEQGKGFAVVADEVRNLAERSGEATKQISAIIKEMQEATLLSVKSVAEGVTSTQRSGEAFENIIQLINETGNKVTEIAGASEEQAAQSAEVLTFIENISATTEETSASSEETASTAQSLTDLAEELNASVASFKVN
ncbi:methyl-accepting chemotaxis protein [Siminovitchia terrae]|uniref:methyl-accepting chemotaxis protein n=1 Tax=Siminovitchia terrae TaxID=1914933 RepID=UPI001B1993DA|nr:methyl-accepting chemotaxis protein [Siminovitchia terrae]GIN90014.1 methyl-accepting chemotaxis protein [Siminovitchia terrae]